MMRSESEIQVVHKNMEGLLNDKELCARASQEMVEKFMSCWTVLSWVLCHHEDGAFSEVVASLEICMYRKRRKSAGFEGINRRRSEDFRMLYLRHDKDNNKAAAMAALFHHCLRCEHAWLRRKVTEPRMCPQCKSLYWNKERVRHYTPGTDGGKAW